MSVSRYPHGNEEIRAETRRTRPQLAEGHKRSQVRRCKMVHKRDEGEVLRVKGEETRQDDSKSEWEPSAHRDLRRHDRQSGFLNRKDHCGLTLRIDEPQKIPSRNPKTTKKRTASGQA